MRNEDRLPRKVETRAEREAPIQLLAVESMRDTGE
jgi:hypothetical protein